MRVLISHVAAAVAALALGPANSGLALGLAMHIDQIITVPRRVPTPRQVVNRSGFPAPTLDRSELFLEGAALKRARKAARRAELAA